MALSPTTLAVDALNEARKLVREWYDDGDLTDDQYRLFLETVGDPPIVEKDVEVRMTVTFTKRLDWDVALEDLSEEARADILRKARTALAVVFDSPLVTIYEAYEA